MAWNDIDWADIRSGWQREQRAQRAQDEETVQNSVRASAQIRQEGERTREFNAGIEERTREFDARLPLIQEQFKSAQDVQYDRTIFPLLMNKLINNETTPEAAASTLRTAPARDGLMAMNTQLQSKKAYAQLGMILQGGADLSTLDGQSKAWSIMGAHPEFGEHGFKALEAAINHAQMSKDRELSALARAQTLAGTTDQLDAAGNIVGKRIIDPMTSQPVPGSIVVGPPGHQHVIPTGESKTTAELTPSQNIARLNAMARIETANIHALSTVMGAAAKAQTAAAQARLATVSEQLNKLGIAPEKAPRAVATGTQFGPPAPSVHSVASVPVPTTRDYTNYGPPLVDRTSGKTWRLKPSGDPKRAEDYEEAQ